MVRSKKAALDPFVLVLPSNAIRMRLGSAHEIHLEPQSLEDLARRTNS